MILIKLSLFEKNPNYIAQMLLTNLIHFPLQLVNYILFNFLTFFIGFIVSSISLHLLLEPPPEDGKVYIFKFNVYPQSWEVFDLCLFIRIVWDDIFLQKFFYIFREYVFQLFFYLTCIKLLQYTFLQKFQKLAIQMGPIFLTYAALWRLA